MPRLGWTTQMAAAYASADVRPAFFVQLEFATEILYVWTGLASYSWNGQVWKGIGELGTIGTISEDSTVEAKGLTVGLSGIPSETMELVLDQTRVLGEAYIYLAAFNEDGSLVPSPYLAYYGLMDQPSIEDGGEQLTCQISLENVLVDLNRSVWRRYTNDDQQMDYPGDTGCQYVPSIQEMTLYWGVSPNGSNR